jgi:hypothetical protein
MKNKETAWDELIMRGIATEQELILITTINGYSLETLESVLFVREGWRSFEQMEEMEVEA